MGGSGDITPFEFPIFRSSPEECSTLLAVPLCFATIRHVVTDRGLRSVADRKCAGAVARSVLRCRPSGFPAVHHIREALAPSTACEPARCSAASQAVLLWSRT